MMVTWNKRDFWNDFKVGGGWAGGGGGGDLVDFNQNITGNISKLK